MVGNALARIVVSSEPMNTGSSTPSTTSMVSRWVRLFWVMGGPASIRDDNLRSHSGTARSAGPGIQMKLSEIASGFRVRAFGAPRNDSSARLRVLDRLPDRVRRRRHLDVADAVVAQR